MKLKSEKFGTIGAIVSAAACPICFPKLALIGTFVGLGALVKYEFYFLVAAQILVLVTLVGILWAYRDLRNLGILFLATASTSLFFVSLYLIVNEYLSYLAFAGLVASIAWQYRDAKKCSIEEIGSIET